MDSHETFNGLDTLKVPFGIKNFGCPGLWSVFLLLLEGTTVRSASRLWPQL